MNEQTLEELDDSSRSGDGMIPVGWSSSRSGLYADQKVAMADGFVTHDFLVEPHGNPDHDVRETAASILVNAGTSPQAVVVRALEWMKDAWVRKKQAFTVRWFSGGALVTGELLDFREKNREFSALAEIFLFPGAIDSNLESVCGEDAASYVERYFSWNITCSILSSHSFNMETGEARFFFPNEIGFQRACALYPARDKFLFLDPSKFRRTDGGRGYDARELLETCENLTIYTVSSPSNEKVVRDFDGLAKGLLETTATKQSSADRSKEQKTFRLCVVGAGHVEPRRHVVSGTLKATNVPVANGRAAAKNGSIR